MDYRLIILPNAERDLRAIAHQPIYGQINRAIVNLAADPRPHGCRKLKDSEGWRLRVGDFRVVYLIDDEVRIVSIERVGHRSGVYSD